MAELTNTVPNGRRHADNILEYLMAEENPETRDTLLPPLSAPDVRWGRDDDRLTGEAERQRLARAEEYLRRHPHSNICGG